eukprot:TRINITY_DN46736_c0_g1_i1.p1 TRINITY_DN46736_c0_g1~~TRINITY_DN46736_c0_g1_i1.p1  ORF type:complete len:919 (-),score=184.58 TRINITY_DN46736_c0_g1_i1:62-2818(-)
MTECPRLSRCLERIEEAQRLLLSVQSVEGALAEAREVLRDIVGVGAGGLANAAACEPSVAHARLPLAGDLASSVAASSSAVPAVRPGMTASFTRHVAPTAVPAAAAVTPGPAAAFASASACSSAGFAPTGPGVPGAAASAADAAVGTEKKVFLDQVILRATEESAEGPSRSLASAMGPRGSMAHRLAPFMIYPDSKKRICWDMLGMLFIVFEVFAIPYNIAFDYEPDGWMFVFVSIMDVYFILDIGASFITGYVTDHGRVCLSPPKVAKRYLRSTFVPDVAAGIPWEWLPVDNKYGQLTKTTRFLRLARLLRLLRIGIVSERSKILIEGNSVISFALGVLRVLILLVGITHWAACGWYAVGRKGLEDGKSWMTKALPEESTNGVRYLYAAFFSLTTMTTVGYGDITAQNPSEVSFAAFLLLIAAIIFPGILSAITDLLVTLNSERTALAEKMQYLSRYMRWRSLPTPVFMEIRAYVQFLWETNKGYDEYEDELKKLLPPVLRKELCYHIYGGILRSAPFFAWMRDIDICLKEMASAIENVFYSRGDVLFRVGQPNQQIHLILSGTLRLSLNESLFSEWANYAADGESDEEEQEEGIERKLNSRLTTTVPAVFTASQFIDRMHSSRRKTTKTAAKKILHKGPFFRSAIIDRASSRLSEEDEDRKWAASFIQRRWRCSRNSIERSGHVRKSVDGKHMKSTTLTAPTYFGESCLWVPYDQWEAGTVPCYTYNVRCESRVELVDIPRSVVREIIERFSPWLHERFEMFREAVVDGFRDRSPQTAQNGGLSSVESSQQLAPEQNEATAPTYTQANGASGPQTAASAPLPPAPWPVDMAESQLWMRQAPQLPAEQILASIRSRAADLTYRSRLRASRLELQGSRRLANLGVSGGRSPGGTAQYGGNSPGGSLTDPLLGGRNNIV